VADDVSRLVRVSAGVGRRLTSACTRPPTRRLLNSIRDAGRRVMRGVGPLWTQKIVGSEAGLKTESLVRISRYSAASGLFNRLQPI
jgi:hypothetical protein